MPTGHYAFNLGNISGIQRDKDASQLYINNTNISIQNSFINGSFPGAFGQPTTQGNPLPPKFQSLITGSSQIPDGYVHQHTKVSVEQDMRTSVESKEQYKSQFLQMAKNKSPQKKRAKK